MPKFGQAWFNGEYFGAKKLAAGNYKNSIRRVPLGFAVHKQFKKTIIFRYRHGNGMFGAIKGRGYQDKYRYSVPISINNPQGEPARIAMRQAVYNWRFVLDAATKLQYHKTATKRKGKCGYHIYIGEYIKAHA